MEMPMIIVKIKYQIIQDILLDRYSRVNIIKRKLYKKVDYNKIESLPFIIIMANEQKVNPMNIIKGLCKQIGKFTYNIIITILKMEKKIQCYSVLLGRP